jgi:hypothetical protein
MRISMLVDARVRDPGGRMLGRVTEIRASDPGDGRPRVRELLLGRAGLRHRLTGRGGATHVVPFDAVRLVGPGHLEVEADRCVPLDADA